MSSIDMRGLTFNEIRDIAFNALRKMFPTEHIYDMGAQQNYRGKDFMEIELPCVTYSLRYELALARVTDEVTTKDMSKMTGTVEEMVPYDVVLVVACHSDVQAESEDMALAVHKAWGRAPCVGGIGFYISDAGYSSSFEITGVYSYQFKWVGWVRIAGPDQEHPLVEHVYWEVEHAPATPGPHPDAEEKQPFGDKPGVTKPKSSEYETMEDC